MTKFGLDLWLLPFFAGIVVMVLGVMSNRIFFLAAGVIISSATVLTEFRFGGGE